MATAVPITPEVLDWAISEAGYDDDDVARKLGVDRDDVRSWRTGETRPLLGKVRALASMLKRPPTFFLLPEPPKDTLPRLEFRTTPDADRGAMTPAERVEVRAALRIQSGVSEVRRALDEPAVDLPRIRTRVAPTRAAARIRTWIGVAVDTQTEWSSHSVALRGWRAALEQKGILVFGLELGQDGIRGFSAWDDYAPVVAYSTAWNTQSRSFTLFHEVAHLVTRTDSACADPHSLDGVQLERWCDEFAAAILMPWEDLVRFLADEIEWPENEEVTLTVARKVANRYRVSLTASVVQLIKNGRASWSLFSAIPRKSDRKKSGGGGGGRTVLQIRSDRYGGATLETFARGVKMDVIDRRSASRYLKVSDYVFDEIEAMVA